MKRWLLLCCLAAAFACTKEPREIAGGDSEKETVIAGSPISEAALKGTLAVKLSREGAQAVAAAQPLAKKTRGGVATRSGVATLDDVLDRIGAERFERIIDYDPEWEAAYDDTGINRWYRIEFDDEVALAEAGQLLASQPEVKVVEYTINPKYRRPMSVGPARPMTAEHLHVPATTRAVGPGMNDPLLGNQWHYENVGVRPELPACQVLPKTRADINLFDAWSLCKGGRDIVVAVIDEPVQTTHPDLAANMWSNPSNPSEHGYNFWNNSATLDWKTAYYDEEYGWEYADHGSHVAGVIAAVNNNGRGVCGIAGGSNGGGVKIMSCQIMGYSNANAQADAEIKAFEYAWKNGAVIAQNSWGYTENVFRDEWLTPGKTEFSALRDAIDTFIKYAGSQNPDSPLTGGLVVFAAGNAGDSNGSTAGLYPGAYAPVIAVGAMNWSYLPAYYTDYGIWVDITAPGGDAVDGLTNSVSSDGYYIFAPESRILSTILCDDSIDYKDGRKNNADLYGYGFMQGTSMACPHVSGVAALGLSYAAQLGKKYTPDEFKALLLSSVYGIDQYFTGTKPGNKMMMDLSLYRNKMGGGCVDALKLLLAIKGTPAVYVKTGEVAAVDFAPYFGGGNAKIILRSVEVSAEGLARIGMSSAPTVSGSKINFSSTSPGTALIKVNARAGDTTFSREFAIVSRAGLAENGGWL